MGYVTVEFIPTCFGAFTVYVPGYRMEHLPEMLWDTGMEHLPDMLWDTGMEYLPEMPWDTGMEHLPNILQDMGIELGMSGAGLDSGIQVRF